MFLYHLLDLQSLALAPWNMGARNVAALLGNPLLPVASTEAGKALAAHAELFERSTRRFEKPDFNISKTKFRGEPIDVTEETILETPFCKLVHFRRAAHRPDVAQRAADDPSVLIVTPMSGHYSTLMRGTVEAMLPSHNVYITDWQDAKMVPLADGFFDLEDQIELIMNIMRLLGPNLHVIGISQASLSVLCAVALLAGKADLAQPLTITLLGGPIDARGRAAVMSELTSQHSLSWFRKNQIQLVPFYYPGAFRMVYPGPMQLLDRMSMTLDRHVTEQIKYYQHLIRGDEDAKEVHDAFYDEFLAVMDVPEEFYLQFIERAFQRCDLPNGSFTWRGEKVDLTAIANTALLTVEGELDDLSPAGQTRAALDLCSGIPSNMKQAHLEIGVGHYGVFNGRKWRNNIQPIIHKFIREHCLPSDETPAK